MPGDYTDAQILYMSPEEVAEAASRGWKKSVASRPTEQVNLPSAVPVSAPSESANVWASNATAGEYDFMVPSGQKCRLRRVTPELLLPLGILDRVTRLEGLADVLIQQAEGQPPAKDKMPSREDFELLLETVNALVTVAVVEPKVYLDNDAEAPDGAIRCSYIDLGDRMAIMERALKGIKMLDRFRHA